MLREKAADRDAASTGSLNCEVSRRGIFLVDEIVSSRHEIIDGVLLRRLHAGLMPRFSTLAATAHMGECDDPSALQPRQQRWIKNWRDGQPVCAIGLKQGWVRAIHCEIFAIKNRQRNHGSIRTLRQDFF